MTIAPVENGILESGIVTTTESDRCQKRIYPSPRMVAHPGGCARDHQRPRRPAPGAFSCRAKVIIEAWRRHYNEVRIRASIISPRTSSWLKQQDQRPAMQRVGALRQMGPPRPGPLLNRPLGDNCSERGTPSHTDDGPKNQGKPSPASVISAAAAKATCF